MVFSYKHSIKFCVNCLAEVAQIMQFFCFEILKCRTKWPCSSKDSFKFQGYSKSLQLYNAVLLKSCKVFEYPCKFASKT